MMSYKDSFRYTIILMIMLCYFLPIITLTAFSMGLMTHSSSWSIFTLGLLISVSGSSVIFVLINHWALIWQKQMIETKNSLLKDSNIAEAASGIKADESFSFNQEKEQTAIEANEMELEEMRQDNASMHKQKKQITQELERLKIAIQEQLIQKDASINEYKQNSSQQRSLIEKLQKQISLLEAKEGDLIYEIKTLLQMSEIAKQPVSNGSLKNTTFPANLPKQPVRFNSDHKEHSNTSSSIRSTHMAAVELHHCIEIAKKAGSIPLSTPSSSLRELPGETTLDQEYLFDCLRLENRCGILLFSPVENKILFVNEEVCQQSGWNPEKFQTGFAEIVHETGMNTWKSSLQQLSSQNEVQMQLPITAQSGIEKLFQCRLGIVPSGTFRNHVIGVLYSQ